MRVGAPGGPCVSLTPLSSCVRGFFNAWWPFVLRRAGSPTPSSTVPVLVSMGFESCASMQARVHHVPVSGCGAWARPQPGQVTMAGAVSAVGWRYIFSSWLFLFEGAERNLRGVEKLRAVAAVEDFKLDTLRDGCNVGADRRQGFHFRHREFVGDLGHAERLGCWLAFSCPSS